MFTIEPGIYVLGDPCYGLNSDDYDVLISEYKDGVAGLVFSKEVEGNNLQCVSLFTAYGDGEYNPYIGLTTSVTKRLSDNKTLLVDSGMIALTHIDLVRNQYEEDESIGVLIEVMKPITITNTNGVMHFGNYITIDTNYNDEEECDDIW